MVEEGPGTRRCWSSSPASCSLGTSVLAQTGPRAETEVLSAPLHAPWAEFGVVNPVKWGEGPPFHQHPAPGAIWRTWLVCQLCGYHPSTPHSSHECASHWQLARRWVLQGCGRQRAEVPLRNGCSSFKQRTALESHPSLSCLQPCERPSLLLGTQFPPTQGRLEKSFPALMLSVSLPVFRGGAARGTTMPSSRRLLTIAL